MPGGEFLIGLGAIGGTIVTLLGVIWRLPMIRAEARKIDVEADDKIVARLYREIDRIDRAMGDLHTEFDDYKASAATEKTTLEGENKQLREKVRKLESRVTGLEAIFKIGPVSPEMQAALDDLKRID